MVYDVFTHFFIYLFHFAFPHLFIINFNLKNLGGRRLCLCFYGLLRYQPVQHHTKCIYIYFAIFVWQMFSRNTSVHEPVMKTYINKWKHEQKFKSIDVNTPLSICMCKTAYCRNSVDGHWYSYDDSSVELVPEEELCTRGAYILFYQRRNVIPPWSANSSVRGQWMSLCGHVSDEGWLTICLLHWINVRQEAYLFCFFFFVVAVCFFFH